MAIQEVNYDVVQGDTWAITITDNDSTGALVNFTGYTFLMTVKDKEGGKIICATATLGNGITNPSTGVIYVELTPTQTLNFTVPKAKYKIQTIDGSGRANTILTGWFNVKAV